MTTETRTSNTVNFIIITSISEENVTNTVLKKQITDNKILKIWYSEQRKIRSVTQCNSNRHQTGCFKIQFEDNEDRKA